MFKVEACCADESHSGQEGRASCSESEEGQGSRVTQGSEGKQGECLCDRAKLVFKVADGAITTEPPASTAAYGQEKQIRRAAEELNTHIQQTRHASAPAHAVWR